MGSRLTHLPDTMITIFTILRFAEEKKVFKTRDAVDKFKVSRQFIQFNIRQLIKEGKLVKIGKTKKAFYRIKSN